MESSLADVMTCILAYDNTTDIRHQLAIGSAIKHAAIKIVVAPREEVGADLVVRGEQDAAAVSQKGRETEAMIPIPSLPLLRV